MVYTRTLTPLNRDVCQLAGVDGSLEFDVRVLELELGQSLPQEMSGCIREYISCHPYEGSDNFVLDQDTRRTNEFTATDLL